MIELSVSLPHRPYEITIEPGLLSRAASYIERVHEGRRAVLVVDDQVASLHGATLRSGFSPEWHVAEHPFSASEQTKHLESVASIYQTALGNGLDRGSLIIGFGGGVTGDVAGFAAASFLRGIDQILIPTTLLAMVDAAIGGKTGVNLPLPDGGIGKNLAGAFWQPRSVLVDPLVLSTLDPRELRSGLAECLKHGFIADPLLLDFLDREADELLAGNPERLARLVMQAVQVKVSIVQSDEREAGRRAALNLGHTFGHAIEPRPELDLRHGEAVAIGMVAAAECAAALGRIDREAVARTRELVARLGLPVALTHPIDASELIAAMRFDKKTRDGQLNLVLPGVGGVDLVDGVGEEDIRAAWRSVGAR